MLALVAAALVVYGVVLCTRKMGDYDVYHRAASRLAAGEEVYRLDDAHRYLYAPILVFPFVPLVPLPLPAGKAVWLAFNLWVAARVIRLSFRLVLGGPAPPGLTVLVLAFALRFLDNNLAHGQMNLVVLWLVLEAYRLAGRERFAAAGLALAGAVLAKIFPAVLLLQLVLRRQWRFLGATIAGTVALLALPAAWWGTGYPDVLAGWIAVVVDQADHYEMGNKINQSISAFAYRAFRPHPFGSPLFELSAEATTGIVLALHAALLIPLVRRSRALAAAGAREPAGPGADELGLWLLYATVLLPYSWKYYFVNLIPALAAALRRLREPSGAALRRGLVAVFVLNLLPGLKLFGRTAALSFQLWSFHFLAVAVLFVVLLRASAAPPAPRVSSPSESSPRG